MHRRFTLGTAAGVLLMIGMTGLLVTRSGEFVPLAILTGALLGSTGVLLGEWIETWDRMAAPVRLLSIITASTAAYLILDRRPQWAVALLLGLGGGAAIGFAVASMWFERPSSSLADRTA
jgi:hypothetical protein